jgi:hypothetical protein
MKYRIRVETDKTGDNWYMPQECTFSILGLWINWKPLSKHELCTMEEATEQLEYRIEMSDENDKRKRVETNYIYID